MDAKGKVSNGKRLIDADKLLTKVVAVSNSMGQVTWSAVSTIDILTAQTVDAVEVVRCKDCKYWQDNNDGYPHEECRWGHGETPDANDFCSYGERKGGD